jgi:hypothetical protein
MSTCLVAGLIAAQLAASSSIPHDSTQSELALFAGAYQTKAASPSFDDIRSVFGSFVDEVADPFVGSITDFYAMLAASQEPLDTAFSRVLYENLWELYER